MVPVMFRDNWKKRVGVRIMVVIGALIGILFFVIGSVIVLNSGDPKPYLHAQGELLPDSISEKGFITINGTNLGYIIKGKNINNPVLLYLHGGMPDYFLTQAYPTGLDELFTVVWLEQRGSGLSYSESDDLQSITAQTHLEDIQAFTLYLRDRFSQDKLYLMAHSGGTYLGVKTIEKFPEYFHAYMGIAQISQQKMSEKLAYDYILEQYSNDPKKRKLVETLKAHPVVMTENIPLEYVKIRDYAMHDLGIGTMHDMKNIVKGLFLPSLLFKEYRVKEKIQLWKAKASSGISSVWEEILSSDLSEESTVFAIPVYFFHGIYDYTCSYDLAEAYYEKIQAPEKAFFTFSHSAHSPIFEEPEKCIEIIKTSILK